MKKITLKKIIYQNYLKTTLTSILFIEIALIILYFYVNGNIVNKSTKFVLEDIKQSVYHRARDIKYHIQSTFDLIEENSKIIQNEYNNFFNNFYNFEIKKRVDFEYAKNGMYYKKQNIGSSVVVSKDTKIDEYLKNELQRGEVFDKNLKIIVENNEAIVAGYFNSRHNYSRYYPFLNESYDVFPSDIKMENYNFYYEADISHNPSKEVVWTDIYLDPAGLGWMISAISPIYKNEVLEGVVGLDITINKMISKFLNFEIPYNGSSFLVDKDSNIVAMTNEIATILDIKDFDEYSYKDNKKISKTIFRKKNEVLNIKNNDFKIILNNIVNNKEFDHEIYINNQKYIIFSEKIDKFSWDIIILIKEDDILKEVKDLEKEYKNIGYMIIAFILIFYIIFFIYLYKKAKDFVFVLNEPLLNIINMTKNLGKKKNTYKLDDCGIEEIDILNKNFNSLANELEDRTNKFIKAEASRAFHEKLSNTDALTKVFNRRFLEDFSSKYFEIVKREKQSLSVLVIDIDNFKNINDKYGHDVGDEVLITLVKYINNSIRKNDFVIRLGGDEFLVLLPNTNHKQSKVVAKKILYNININNTSNKTFTISVGCSEYKFGDEDINSLIKRADEALYKAKNSGKNSIV